jgi:hypothetical protein
MISTGREWLHRVEIRRSRFVRLAKPVILKRSLGQTSRPLIARAFERRPRQHDRGWDQMRRTATEEVRHGEQRVLALRGGQPDDLTANRGGRRSKFHCGRTSRGGGSGPKRARNSGKVGQRWSHEAT